ncbi:MAG: hypothetical protein O2900_04635 [Proteobacteria bacterium]|jgi:hypothetical protein|nr:hypothetical protein [Pseudomonadota bacterium]
MSRYAQGIKESEWKIALYQLGMVYCWSVGVAFWYEPGTSGLESFIEAVGMVLVCLWFWTYVLILRETAAETKHLNDRLHISETRRELAEARVSELEGIIEKARARSRSRRQRNNE